jgi:hypothetical protein
MPELVENLENKISLVTMTRHYRSFDPIMIREWCGEDASINSIDITITRAVGYPEPHDDGLPINSNLLKELCSEKFSLTNN